jgi:parvulin-like peptidyl-prolyl isomerase
LTIKALLKEPLLHFLLTGAGLFLLFDMSGEPSPPAGGLPGSPALEVVVTQNEIRQMMGRFVKTWQRTPTDEETQRLIESLIRDEIYYREALAAGLDRNDNVIRRRMRLKMEYLFEDVATQVEPTDQQLQAFLDQNADSYLLDPTIGFRQVYINADRRGTEAQSDARSILIQLVNGANPDTVGDPFLLGAKFSPTALQEIEDQFGETFASALLELAPGRWQGPIRSGFGLHLVQVEERVDAHVPELDAVRDAVKRDWAVTNQQRLKDAAYARVRERYHVVVEPPHAGASTATATLNLEAVN